MRPQPYIFDLTVSDSKIDFSSPIKIAIDKAEAELANIEETIKSIDVLKPDCDKLDYIIACCSGALCGICDIFLVGKPGESPVGKITDTWFANRTIDFAKLCGWNDNGNLNSALRFLENKYKVPYDQTGAEGVDRIGDTAKILLGLTPKNHHFKSLAHNPSLLGLFFSILDQFNNTSTFISRGALITVLNTDEGVELRGNNIIAKLFCATINWFGHLMSDVSGSSSSSGRGMGIPSPLWTWINDIIAIKSKLRIPVFEFENSINDLAIKIFEKGFDMRFQTAQVIPVVFNDLIVRMFYAVRRLVKYFKSTPKSERNLSLMWKYCESFSNATVKRMLTVAHGVFCIVDIAEASARGVVTGCGTFNFIEFFLRLNIAGIGRFTISLYGEVKRGIKIIKVEENVKFAKRERVIVNGYIEGLKVLSELYNDYELLTFVSDFEKSDLYVQGFRKSCLLAEKRNVPENKILRSKTDIDNYFNAKR